MKRYKAKDATIALTYKCNSRCKMCNIWQIEEIKELPLAYFYNLNKDLRHVNLSGGETFLRAELPEIIKIVKNVCPRAQIIISTNGLATDLIVEKTAEILKIDKNIGIRVSLDGIGEAHDYIRGIKGFYEQVIKTVQGLKEIGVKNLGLSFTIMERNAGELKAVYDLAKSKNLELALALVQNSEIYFQKSDNKINNLDEIEKGLNYIIGEELKSHNVKRWLRAYYDYGLLYYSRHKKRLLKSGAGYDSLFIDPSGDIYPSNLINIKMGNLGDGKLKKTWNSPEAKNIRKRMKEKGVTESWIICTIRGEMKKHFLKIGWWIVKNKLC